MTKAIGVVGTAKNTGKTTTLTALVRSLTRAGRKVAVTSIGYDGEAVDNLTLLPKPRIELPPGALVATAERCLQNATLTYDLVARTEATTSLGRVVVVEVTAAGRVIAAGPNQRQSLERVAALLAQRGSEVILIDGALARLAPMSAADGLIFTTGAARSTSLSELAVEMEAIHFLLNLPLTTNRNLPRRSLRGMSVITADGAQIEAGLKTLLDQEQADQLFEVLPPQPRSLLLSGLIVCQALDRLVDRLRASGLRPDFIAPDPLGLLLAGEPIRVVQTVRRLREAGMDLSLLKAVPLLAVTVNPFYPKRVKGAGFAAAYVDRRALKERISAVVSAPVVDIETQGPEALVRVLDLEDDKSEIAFSGRG